ncbi:hypothetical protein ACIF8T_21665 [Streptomyces sp. NPDC085946]|uniref:hypothetical protein n=1 Tax=Streptomyces sp. NPDC085946 TaxID=3365744 RepID=UPI0037D3A674
MPSSDTNSLWDTLMRISDQVEARQKQEQAAKEAAEAEAARKAPRTIARYLTVAGSSLAREDLAVDIVYTSSTGWITATCAGCGASERTDPGGYVYDTPEEEQARVDKALPHARPWAQSHAGTCRALPGPTA